MFETRKGLPFMARVGSLVNSWVSLMALKENGIIIQRLFMGLIFSWVGYGISHLAMYIVLRRATLLFVWVIVTGMLSGGGSGYGKLSARQKTSSFFGPSWKIRC